METFALSATWWGMTMEILSQHYHAIVHKTAFRSVHIALVVYSLIKYLFFTLYPLQITSHEWSWWSLIHAKDLTLLFGHWRTSAFVLSTNRKAQPKPKIVFALVYLTTSWVVSLLASLGNFLKSEVVMTLKEQFEIHRESLSSGFR